LGTQTSDLRSVCEFEPAVSAVGLGETLDVERVAQAWELESWRRGGIGRAAARLKGAQTRR